MKPVLLFSVVMLLMCAIGLVVGLKVNEPAKSQLPQILDRAQVRLMPESDRMRYYESIYSEVRSSFISFDLANGLTWQDIRVMRSNIPRVFYLLLGGLFLAKLLKKPKT